MEEVTFELGPAGGKGLRMERKEISHGRTAGSSGEEMQVSKRDPK